MIGAVVHSVLLNEFTKYFTTGIYRKLGKGLINNFPKTLTHLKKETKDAIRVMRQDSMYKGNIPAYLPIYGTISRANIAFRELKKGGVLRQRYADYTNTYSAYRGYKQQTLNIFNRISKKDAKATLKELQAIHLRKGKIDISDIKGMSNVRKKVALRDMDNLNKRISKLNEYEHITKIAQAKLLTRTSRFGRDVVIPGVMSMYMTKKLYGVFNKEER